MPGRPTVIVLAAGQGQRFRQAGGSTHKLDAPLAGMAVLQHVLQTVAASGLPFYVVQPVSSGGGAVPQGMGDSIVRGVQATADSVGWLILPGDLPLVRADSLQRVADRLSTSPVVLPQWQGRSGHPVGFAAACRASLLALQGGQGAAAVVQTHRQAGTLDELTLDDPGLVMDIDTPADLARAEAWLATTAAGSGDRLA